MFQLTSSTVWTVKFKIRKIKGLILASGRTHPYCKIKETLLIQELKPALNVNISSDKLLLY